MKIILVLAFHQLTLKSLLLNWPDITKDFQNVSAHSHVDVKIWPILPEDILEPEEINSQTSSPPSYVLSLCCHVFTQLRLNRLTSAPLFDLALTFWWWKDIIFELKLQGDTITPTSQLHFEPGRWTWKHRMFLPVTFCSMCWNNFHIIMR